MGGSNGSVAAGPWGPLTAASAGEASEADAQEQLQDAVAGGAGTDPEAPVGRPTGRDLDSALASANEADLAEQSLEVAYDDDEL